LLQEELVDMGVVFMGLGAVIGGMWVIWTLLNNYGFGATSIFFLVVGGLMYSYGRYA
jgi:hypothetical protein